MHQFSSFDNEADGVFFCDNAGGAQGTVFTETVAGGYFSGKRFFFQNRQYSQIDGCYGRLQVYRLRQIFHGSIEAEFRQIDLGNIRSHVKDFSNELELLIDVLSHADRLGPLAWKQKGYVFQF